jgi:hypothetical protein
VFPRADPYTAVWDQADGKALERSGGVLEQWQHSNEHHVCNDEDLRWPRA